MSNLQTVSIDVIRSLAFGSVSGTYAAVGGPLTHPVRLICITNSMDADMLVSIDGTNDNLYLPAGTFKLFDLVTNRLNNQVTWAFPIGTQFYVKQVAAPSKGRLTIECLWGE